MIWVHAFHVVFVVTWFAGLFYLPRVFVYSAMHPEIETQRVLLTMQRKLMGITHIGGALALTLGLAMLVWNPVYLELGWMHAKLMLVLALIGYHVWCWRLVGVFQRGENQRSHVWYRWFNEAPALLLVGIVVLAIVKPF